MVQALLVRIDAFRTVAAGYPFLRIIVLRDYDLVDITRLTVSYSYADSWAFALSTGKI